MINAKEELLSKTGSATIVCAKIQYKGTTIELSSFDNEVAYEEFLGKLDFNYKIGFGEHYLYGFAVLADGSWLERTGPNGPEVWEHRVKPEMF